MIPPALISKMLPFLPYLGLQRVAFSIWMLSTAKSAMVDACQLLVYKEGGEEGGHSRYRVMGKLSFERFLRCRRTTRLCQAPFLERVTAAQLPITRRACVLSDASYECLTSLLNNTQQHRHIADIQRQVAALFVRGVTSLRRSSRPSGKGIEQSRWVEKNFCCQM